MNKLAVVIAGSVSILAAVDAFASRAPVTWDGMTTAAAMGYCLANHPYQTIHAGPFTPDGYEIASFPGVVGATRRNLVRERTTLSTPLDPTMDTDEGVANTCQAACKQWGLGTKGFMGVPLRQMVAGGRVMPSGVGDLAHAATFDVNFYTWTWEVAAMSSTSNNWHLSDVAQADYCCCHMVPVP